jgi:hypothetical protein
VGTAPREIGAEEELTQYGTVTEPFRTRPRPGIENAVSLLAGGFSPLEAGDRVRRQALNDGTDAARYTTAGALRAAGFDVTHTPTKRNADHVSVEFVGEWDDKASVRFDACFGDVEVADPPRYNDDDETDLDD